MKVDIVKSIQYHFKQLTNSSISKHDVQKFILPIIEYIINNNYNKYLLSGSQGIGKTTLLKIIEVIIKKEFNKKVLSLSLDNFYYDKKFRKKLGKNIHPLLTTRGVPGTHDTIYLLNILKKFNKSKYPLRLPLFEKLSDSRKKQYRLINTKCDILILEGWCLGCPPISRKFLLSNFNILEKKFDNNFKWREYYNNQLKNNYLKIFKQFDSIIYLKAPSFSHVLNWRIKQEKYLKKIRKNENFSGMSRIQIKNFIQYYEKITRWMLIKMPALANIVLHVNKDQKICKIIKN